jgi:hypothetical protein
MPDTEELNMDIETHEVEFFLMIDGYGNYVVDTDENSLGDRWTGDQGDMPNITRVFKFNMTVPGPKPTEVNVVVPDKEDDEIKVTVT